MTEHRSPNDEDCTPCGETVEYWLLLDGETNYSVPTLEQCLVDAQHIARDFIWHQEPFTLHRKDLPQPHMYGSTQFGVCAEDEWLVVHLLRQLSIMHPQLVIRVRDSDGDPLLIEAADHLPEWLDDDVAARNRTYIHTGYVHVIPHPSSSPSSADVQPFGRVSVDTQRDGAALIRLFVNETRAPEISSVIEARCARALHWQGISRHHCHVLVPVTLAHVLSTQTHTLPHAIHAFLDRSTGKDAQLCRQLPVFNASSSSSSTGMEEMVPLRVTFTRHLYAMLAQHAFVPDKRCSSWPKTSPASTQPLTARRLNDGYKLACGYEILFARAGTSTDAGVDARTWKKYAKRLQTRGYFGEEVVGSQTRARLEAQARQYLAQSLAFGAKQPSDSESSRTVVDSVSVLRKLDCEAVVLLQQRYLNEAEGAEEDDSLHWMQVDGAALDGGMDDIEALVQPIRQLLEETAPKPPAPPPTATKFASKSSAVRPTKLSTGKARSRSRRRGPAEEEEEDVNLCNDEQGMAMLDFGLMHDSDKPYDSSDEESYGEEDLHIDLDEKSLRDLQSFHSTMKSYMRSMDDELESSTVRHSQLISHPIKLLPADKPSTTTTRKAVKLHALPKPIPNSAANGESSTASRSPGSFVPRKTDSSDSINDIDDDEMFTPVDIDRNLVMHLMNARDAQQTVDGPLTSLVAMAGLHNGGEKK